MPSLIARIALGAWLVPLGHVSSSFSAAAPAARWTTSSPEAAQSFEEGLVAFDLRRMAEAEERFRRAIDADPDFAVAHAYRGLALNYTGEAWTELERAAELAVDASPAERALIESSHAWKRGDRAQAVSVLDELADPPRQALFQLALVRFRERDHERAEEALERLLDRDASFAPAHLLLARARSERGDHDGAKRSLDRARALLGGDHPALSLAEADTLLSMGDLAAAAAAFSRALELDPGSVYALERRAWTHLAREELSAARRDYAVACDVLREHPDGAFKELWLDWLKAEDVCFSLGTIHLLEGNLESADRELLGAATYSESLRPDTAPVFWNALGRFRLETGNFEGARAAYEHGHEVSRNAPISERMKTLWRGRFEHASGRLRARQGRFDEALAHAKTLQEMIDEAGEDGRPFQPSYHYLMGYILLEQERHAEAVAHLERADRDDPFIRFLLARAYRGAGRRGAADEIVASLRKRKGGGFPDALIHAALRAWDDRGP